MVSFKVISTFSGVSEMFSDAIVVLWLQFKKGNVVFKQLPQHTISFQPQSSLFWNDIFMQKVDGEEFLRILFDYLNEHGIENIEAVFFIFVPIW